MINLPPLLPEYESTRATLHAYALAISTIARTHAIAHPKWWHVSLALRPEGLASDPIPLANGGAVAMTMDLKRHEIVFRASDGDHRLIDMRERPTATEAGRILIAACSAHGLENDYDRQRFESDEPRAYEPEAAEAYFDAFTAVAAVFARHRAVLGDRVSPVQLWPHGFDLSFEWFGTKTVDHDGESLPSQINLGFYPGGDEPYFYSNPWPFDDALAVADLPDGAQWHTGDWSGAVLDYKVVRTTTEPGATLMRFAKTVFEMARPSLETQ